MIAYDGVIAIRIGNAAHITAMPAILFRAVTG